MLSLIILILVLVDLSLTIKLLGKQNIKYENIKDPYKDYRDPYTGLLRATKVNKK